MTMQFLGVLLIILIIAGAYVIYKSKKSSLKQTETFKTRIEKGENIFKK